MIQRRDEKFKNARVAHIPESSVPNGEVPHGANRKRRAPAPSRVQSGKIDEPTGPTRDDSETTVTIFVEKVLFSENTRWQYHSTYSTRRREKIN